MALLLGAAPSFSIASEAIPVPAPDLPDVRLGIVYYTRPSRNEIIIPATIKAIQDRIGREHVVVKRYSLPELAAAIRENEVDVFLASSGFYRTMVQHGARDLATLASLEEPNPSKNDGSAFVVRRNSPYATLMDAAGGRLGATSPTAFLGYLAGLGEVARQGGDPDSFFSETSFYGGDDGAVGILEALRKGEADIGVFRRCWLEDHVLAHPEDAGEFRVLDPRPEGGRCERSTDLYPTWTIASAPALRSEVSRLVATAVLDMPPTVDGLYWGVATDFRKVDDLYKTLRLGPYAYLREWSLQRFLAAYWPGFAIALVLLACLIAHALRTDFLVKKRTAQLQTALRIQKALQEQAREASRKISSMEKIGIIGQLCSLFAHEMRQPLGAIALYAQGLRSLARNGRATGPQLMRALDKLEEQSKRASGIVDRVRAYSKSRDAERKPFLLNDAVLRAVENYEASAGWPVRIETSMALQAKLVGDPLEMELVAYNLIKNAAQAVKGMEAGRVGVSLAGSGKGVLLSVTDNGPVPPEDVMAQLADPAVQFESHKADGLGLGLMIVRAIVEKNGGRLSYEAGKSQGVTARVFLPLPEDETESETEGEAESGALEAGGKERKEQAAQAEPAASGSQENTEKGGK